MGFLDKLFGTTTKKYPPLAAESPTAKELASMKDPLEALMRDVSDPMEIVPAPDNRAYVFIGNPRKNFGMAWIEDGEIHNFKTLQEQKGVQQAQLLKMVAQLQEAYHRSGDDKRFSTSIGDRDVVVTPSSHLASEVNDIISGTS